MKYIDDDNLKNSSFENKYDLKIYNWTINELPIYLSEYEKNEMKELYGNRKTGKLYRGMAIDDIETLERIEKIINKNNDTFTFHIPVSSTPDKFTAKTFMEYTKSYDPYTMSQGMKKLFQTGCKGELASVLIEFEIKDSNQVLFKNYHDEFDEDKNSLIPSQTAEMEVFFEGEVKILSIQIQYPLTIENYKENILNNINKVDDLKNPPYKMWIEKNLSEEKQIELSYEIIKKLKNNYKDIKEFYQTLIIELYSKKLNPLTKPLLNKLFELEPNLESYIVSKLKLKQDDIPYLYMKINKEIINLNEVVSQTNISNKYMHLFSKKLEKQINDFSSNERFNLIPFNSFKFRKNEKQQDNENDKKVIKYISLDYIDYYKFKKLLEIFKNDEKMINLLVSTNYYKENNKIIVDFLKNIVKTKKEFTDENLEFLQEIFYNLNEIKPFVLNNKKEINDVFNYFYKYIESGHLDKEKQDFLNKYSRNFMAKFMNTCVEILQFINKFEDIEFTKDKKNDNKVNIDR